MTSPSDSDIQDKQLEDIYLNRKSLMAHFNIKERRTIDSWIENNSFPKPIRLGGVLRWKMSEVAEWSASRSSRRNKQIKEQNDE